MNILPQIRSSSALLALAIVAPVVFLAGGNFHLPVSGGATLSMDKSVVLDISSDGVVDELQAVRTTLASARDALSSGDYPLASRLAEEAKIDAQVAERHAQSTHARKAAQDSQNDARALRAEIALKSQPQAMAAN